MASLDVAQRWNLWHYLMFLTVYYPCSTFSLCYENRDIPFRLGVYLSTHRHSGLPPFKCKRNKLVHFVLTCWTMFSVFCTHGDAAASSFPCVFIIYKCCWSKSLCYHEKSQNLGLKKCTNNVDSCRDTQEPHMTVLERQGHSNETQWRKHT